MGPGAGLELLGVLNFIPPPNTGRGYDRESGGGRRGFKLVQGFIQEL